MLHTATSLAAMRDLAKETRAAIDNVEAGVDLLAAATGIDGASNLTRALMALKRWVGVVEAQIAS
jgi:hypothetical protein